MYNLLLPMLMCYMLKPYALKTSYCNGSNAGLTANAECHHTVLCGVLYTACVDTSKNGILGLFTTIVGDQLRWGGKCVGLNPLLTLTI